MDLYYIIYCSIPGKAFCKADVKTLLAAARGNNEKFGITGMLIYLPDLFIQMIEGPKAEILRLYRNIEQDNRHYRVVLVKEGPVDHRRFPDWSMGVDDHEVPLSDPRQSFLVSDDKVFSLFNLMDMPETLHN